ncbi:MAG: GNAT family N-acetyltransferase [Hyphomicrobiaceae bacterium]
MPRLWTPQTIGARASLLRWAERRMQDDPFDPERAIPVAVMADTEAGEELRAVVVYFNRRGVSIEMAIASASRRWATREALTELLAYPFVAFGCRRATAITRSTNHRAQRLLEGLGFAREGQLGEAFEDCDALVYGFTRSAWLASRWCRYWHAAHVHKEAA